MVNPVDLQMRARLKVLRGGLWRKGYKTGVEKKEETKWPPDGSNRVTTKVTQNWSRKKKMHQIHLLVYILVYILDLGLFKYLLNI